MECLEIQAFHCACAQRPTVTARFKTISCWADSFHFKSVYLCGACLLELFSLGRSASELFHPCFATAQGGACQGSKTSLTVTPPSQATFDGCIDPMPIPCQQARTCKISMFDPGPAMNFMAKCSWQSCLDY